MGKEISSMNKKIDKISIPIIFDIKNWFDFKIKSSNTNKYVFGEG